MMDPSPYATMTLIPGLRSPYAKVGRIVYFGRMLDKIRLHAQGKLPPDWVESLGSSRPSSFDGRCCRFLRVGYDEVKARALAGKSDEEILAWAEEQGGRRSDEECETWNGFMMKRGWRDGPDMAKRLAQRIADSRLEGKTIETMFDYIDFDEGRDPVSARAWENA